MKRRQNKIKTKIYIKNYKECPALPAPGFVKIDVEGAELTVLQGAERLLSEVRPSVYIEVDEASAEAVFALFVRHGYAAFDPANDFGDDRPLAACIENTLFVPRATPA